MTSNGGGWNNNNNNNNNFRRSNPQQSIQQQQQQPYAMGSSSNGGPMMINPYCTSKFLCVSFLLFWVANNRFPKGGCTVQTEAVVFFLFSGPVDSAPVPILLPWWWWVIRGRLPKGVHHHRLSQQHRAPFVCETKHAWTPLSMFADQFRGRNNLAVAAASLTQLGPQGGNRHMNHHHHLRQNGDLLNCFSFSMSRRHVDIFICQSRQVPALGLHATTMKGRPRRSQGSSGWIFGLSP